jgi:4'-phosphopantetheinyl transferase
LTVNIGSVGSMPVPQFDLWWTRFSELANHPVLHEYRQILNAEERAKEPVFYFPKDRLRYLVTRALVRTVLARYLSVAAADLRFVQNHYGRPELEAPAGLSFNISHTDGLIVLAVSRCGDVGVDVENVVTRNAALELAPRFFAPVEARELAALPPHEQPERFFEYWTFKESYIKARGMGLSLPLHQFAFHYPGHDTVELTTERSIGDDAKRWSFAQLRPSSDFILALCTPRLDVPARLTVRDIKPLLSEEVVEADVIRRSVD